MIEPFSRHFQFSRTISPWSQSNPLLSSYMTTYHVIYLTMPTGTFSMFSFNGELWWTTTMNSRCSTHVMLKNLRIYYYYYYYFYYLTSIFIILLDFNSINHTAFSHISSKCMWFNPLYYSISSFAWLYILTHTVFLLFCVLLCASNTYILSKLWI